MNNNQSEKCMDESESQEGGSDNHDLSRLVDELSVLAGTASNVDAGMVTTALWNGFIGELTKTITSLKQQLIKTV